MNKIIIIGNLCNDPAMSRKSNRKDVCRFRVADNRNYTKADGARAQETEWFNCNAYDATAQQCMDMLQRGRQVYIEGTLSSSTYTGSDNVERTGISVLVHSFMALGPGIPHSPDQAESENAANAASVATTEVHATAPTGKLAGATNGATKLEDFEEDEPL